MATITVSMATLATLMSRSLAEQTHEAIYQASLPLIGDFDFNLDFVKTNTSGFRYFNGTRVLKHLDTIPDIRCAVRSIYRFEMPKNPTVFAGYDDSKYTREIAQYAVAVLVDIHEERKRGLITDSKIIPLQANQTYVTRYFMNKYKFPLESNLVLRWFPMRYFEFNTRFSELTSKPPPYLYDTGFSYIDTVLLQDASGFKADRFTLSFNAQVFADAQNVLLSYRVSDRYDKTKSKEFEDIVNKENMLEYASYIVCKLVDPMKYYNEYLFSITKNKLYALGSRMMDALKTTALSLDYGILDQLSVHELDVQNIIIVSTIFAISIVAISMLIVYTILGIVLYKQRTETTVMRVLGSKTTSLLFPVFLYAVVIAISGIALAYLLSIAVYSVANKYTSIFSNEGRDLGIVVRPSTSNWLFAAAVGLFGTLLTFVLNTSHLFSTDLPTLAKPQSHSQLQSTVVVVDSSATRYSSSTLTLIATSIFSTLLTLALIVITPYLLYNSHHPYTSIQSLILLSFALYGSTLFLSNLSPPWEHWLALALSSLDQPWMSRIVAANLAAGRRRNQFTTIVFALSLSLVALLFSSMESYLKSGGEQERFAGLSADVIILGFLSFNLVDKISAELNKAKIEFTLIEMYSKFDSLILSKGYSSILTKSASLNLEANQSLHVVTPKLATYFSKAHYSSYFPQTIHGESSIKPIELLYTRFGQAGAIISESVAQKFSLDCSNQDKNAFNLEFQSTLRNQYSTLQLQCVATASYLPGLNFTRDAQAKVTDAFMNLESGSLYV